LGAVFVAVTTAANEGVPAGHAGPSAAALNASQQVGGALGLAVFSAIATARAGHLLASHTPPPEAMTSMFQRALLARSLCLAFAALFALRTTNTRGEEPEDPEEARDRAGAGHVERLWCLPSPDAALWATRSPSHQWRTARRCGSDPTATRSAAISCSWSSSRRHELLGERPAMGAHADIAGRGLRVVENAVPTIDCRTPSISSSSRSRPRSACASCR
jgi:hypothetical protein